MNRNALLLVGVSLASLTGLFGESAAQAAQLDPRAVGDYIFKPGDAVYDNNNNNNNQRTKVVPEAVVASKPVDLIALSEAIG